MQFMLPIQNHSFAKLDEIYESQTPAHALLSGV
jgi:hypothetical protein